MKQIRTLSERKRASIVEAAITEFLNKGFQATSMDGLAARACVSKRTVYNHFPSKDDLFMAMVADLGQRCGGNGECPYSSTEPLEDQLRAS
ncbi:MAG: TetR/AcrR family transcriptional regulator, partial [Chromatiales bacterium]|nr:TetR/AcrR family transcriptional regulator [Chromatiales bacterium]